MVQNGYTAIIWAARMGYKTMVEMLLKAGADPLKGDNVSEYLEYGRID
jgi:ankyrin repeat protein